MHTVQALSLQARESRLREIKRLVKVMHQVSGSLRPLRSSTLTNQLRIIFRFHFAARTTVATEGRFSNLESSLAECCYDTVSQRADCSAARPSAIYVGGVRRTAALQRPFVTCLNICEEGNIFCVYVLTGNYYPLWALISFCYLI